MFVTFLFEIYNNLHGSAEIRLPFNLWKCYALINKPFLPGQLVPIIILNRFPQIYSYKNSITKAVFGGPKFFTTGGTLRGTLISAEPFSLFETLHRTTWIYSLVHDSSTELKLCLATKKKTPGIKVFFPGYIQEEKSFFSNQYSVSAT